MTQHIEILFINPGRPANTYQGLSDEFSAVEPPVIALGLMDYMLNRGATCKLLDVAAGAADELDAIAIEGSHVQPSMVVVAVYGFQPSASTQNMDSAYLIAGACKEAWGRDIPVILTGTHPSALPRQTLAECVAVDGVIQGEGPVTIWKLWQAIVKGGMPTDVRLPGYWARMADDPKTLCMPPAHKEDLIADLGREMPRGGLIWGDMDLTRYRAHNWHTMTNPLGFSQGNRSPYASIHTSLGCPYNCAFCCINAPFGKPSYRLWPAEQVVREIAYLVEVCGVTNIKIADEMFLLNDNHVQGICTGLISRGLGSKLNIWAYARVDTVQNMETVEMLRAAGIRWLALGIESASELVRDGQDKKFKYDDIASAVAGVQKMGVKVLGNFIFGLPDDTVGSMRETEAMAMSLNLDWINYYAAMAYPGSRLYDDASKQSGKLPARWGDFSQHAYGSFPLSNATLSAADILGFRDAAWTRTFHDPNYLNSIAASFGAEAVAHVKRMAEHKLRRRLLGDSERPRP